MNNRKKFRFSPPIMQLVKHCACQIVAGPQFQFQSSREDSPQEYWSPSTFSVSLKTLFVDLYQVDTK